MYSCIKPTQYVREHETDYLFQRLGRYYIRTHYAGTVEITENEYNTILHIYSNELSNSNYYI